MWNLVKLEYRKCKIKRELIGVIIANVLIFLVFFDWGFQIKGFSEWILGINLVIPGIDTTIIQIISTITVVFVIYGGIFFVELYSEEFEFKTIKNSFTLPHGRRNIILSKVLSALLFMIVAIIVTFAIQVSIMITANIYLGLYETITIPMIIANIPELIVSIIIGITAVLLVVIISFFIKSTTFNVFASIFVGILASMASEFIKWLEIIFLTRAAMAVAFLVGLSIIFFNRLGVEVKKDI